MTLYHFGRYPRSANARCRGTLGKRLKWQRNHRAKKISRSALQLRLEKWLKRRSKAAPVAEGKLASVRVLNRGKSVTTGPNASLLLLRAAKPRRVPVSGIVFSIVDKKRSGRGYRYRVKWRDDPNGYRWDDTWETGSALRKDGFSEACSIVDSWKLSDEVDFFQYCSRQGRPIGASPKGRCAVYAVDVAAGLLGNTEWSNKSTIDQFYGECNDRGRPISQNGLTYGELRRYVKFSNARVSSNAREISTQVLDKNLLGGINGKSAAPKLKAVILPDGIYICAAFNSLGVSHCIAIQVVMGKNILYDEENSGVCIADFDLTWVYGISFIRKVDLYVDRRIVGDSCERGLLRRP